MWGTRNSKKAISERVSKKLPVMPSGTIADLGDIEGQKGRLTTYEYILALSEFYLPSNLILKKIQMEMRSL